MAEIDQERINAIANDTNTIGRGISEFLLSQITILQEQLVDEKQLVMSASNELVKQNDEMRDIEHELSKTEIDLKSLSLSRDELRDDMEWCLKTFEWLSDQKDHGGITTCANHNGHGFSSDCEVCAKVRELSEKHKE